MGMVILGENLFRTNHQMVEEDCGIKTEQMKCRLVSSIGPRIDRTLVWVRIPDLNVVYYNGSFLLALATTLGAPVRRNQRDGEGFHCLKKCMMSRKTWSDVALDNTVQIDCDSLAGWIIQLRGNEEGLLFMSTIWWIWRQRNILAFGETYKGDQRLLSNIYRMVEDMRQAWHGADVSYITSRMVSWSRLEDDTDKLDVHATSLGNPGRVGISGA